MSNAMKNGAWKTFMEICEDLMRQTEDDKRRRDADPAAEKAENTSRGVEELLRNM